MTDHRHPDQAQAQDLVGSHIHSNGEQYLDKDYTLGRARGWLHDPYLLDGMHMQLGENRANTGNIRLTNTAGDEGEL